MSVLFYTVATPDYECFVPLYIYYTLLHNADASVEIGLADAATYTKTHATLLAILRARFPARITLTTVAFATPPHATRFTTTPTTAADHTHVYIGDIDILILDTDVTAQHLDHMHTQGVPFSNWLRNPTAPASDRRLTGLHFAPTALQYPLQITSITAHPHALGYDEKLLYQQMRHATTFSDTDFTHPFRPLHGIHTSLNRHPFGLEYRSDTIEIKRAKMHAGEYAGHWQGIESTRYQVRFLELLTEPTFVALYPHLDLTAKNILLLLENIYRDRFSELQAATQQYVLGRQKRYRWLRTLTQAVRRVLY